MKTADASYLKVTEALEDEGARRAYASITSALDHAMLRFATEEAEFLNEQLYKFLPKILINTANNRRLGFFGRMALALISISLYVQGIKVVRNTHRGIQSGKGFRDGKQIVTIDAVTSTIEKRGTVIASKRFSVGVIDE